MVNLVFLVIISVNIGVFIQNVQKLAKKFAIEFLVTNLVWNNWNVVMDQSIYALVYVERNVLKYVESVIKMIIYSKFFLAMKMNKMQISINYNVGTFLKWKV